MPANARKLLLRQLLFAELASQLIQKIIGDGYGVTIDEAYRPPETAALYASQGRGSKDSCHCQKLAIDLNLFQNFTYCESGDEYAAFGAWWKDQHVLCRWGGDFKSRDYRHFSLEWQGHA